MTAPTLPLARRPGPALACGALLATILALAALPAGRSAAEPLSVASTRVPLDPEDRTRTALGALHFRGGLSLSSADRRFGGLSGLLVEPDGSLIALSDEGHWIRLRPTLSDGRLTGIGAAQIFPLADLTGQRLRGKAVTDAESLARLADGAVLVSFERRHRLLRYPAGADPLAAIPEPFAAPPGQAALARNQGLEAVAALPDGRILALAEGRNRDGRHPAFLWQGGRWSSLAYQAPPRFAPTGATRLPSGDLLVLERAFTWLGGLAARLLRVEAAALRPGAVLAGREIAVLGPPLTVDNFEGIAAASGGAGEILVYLISDDNFSPFQRTLLMLFAIAEGVGPESSGAGPRPRR